MVKKFLSVCLLLFIIAAIPLTVQLSQQKQELRKKAATSTQAIITLVPQRAPPYYVGENLKVDLIVNTQNNPIDAIQVFLTPTTGLPITAVQNNLTGLNWSTFSPTTQPMRFLLFAPPGTTFQNNQNQSLVTFTLSPTATGTYNLSYDRTFTKVLVAGINLLSLTDLIDGSYTFSVAPTPTPTSTPTSIPTSTPTPTSTPLPTPKPTFTPTPTVSPTPQPGTVTIDDSIMGTGLNQFNYSATGWTHCTNCNETGVTYYNASQSWADITNATVSVNFTGTQIKLYGVKASWHGIAAISIDNGAQTNVDFYSTTKVGDQLIYTSPVLVSGNHTLLLRATGTKNVNSTGIVIPIDRADILTGISTPTPTLTPIPTSTPTPRPTSTPTPAPTSTPVPVSSLTLKLQFEGISLNSVYQPLRFMVIQGFIGTVKKFEQTVNAAWSTNQYVANLIFPTFEAGSYHLLIKSGGYGSPLMPLYLQAKAGPYNLSTNITNQVDLTGNPLLVGNLNNDNVIESIDLSLLLGKIRIYQFNKLSQQTTEDLNADYYVDGTDLSLLLKNVFKTDTVLP